MSEEPVQSWADRALGFAISAVVVVLLLRLAWTLLQPLMPVLLVGLGLYVGLRWWLHRREYW